ncbi:hypothetical protein D3C87_1652900 [compost metagenome]
MVRQVHQFLFGVLDRTDVGKHRDVMAELPQIVANDADGLPLRIDFTAFAPVPDFPTPLAYAVEGREHRLVEIRRVTTGLEQAGALTQHFIALIAGYLHEGRVDVNDQAFAISDQHAFTGAIEHRSRLSQALTIFATFAQPGADSQTTQQARPGNEDQPRAEYHPGITVDQLPP